MTARGDIGTSGAALAGTGAATGATLVAACCVPVVSPLLVTVLGVGSAVWLAGLKPYSSYLLAGSLVFLAYGFWSVYGRRPDGRVCAPSGRARRLLARVSVLLLWLAAFAWVAAATSLFVLS